MNHRMGDTGLKPKLLGRIRHRILCKQKKRYRDVVREIRRDFKKTKLVHTKTHRVVGPQPLVKTGQGTFCNHWYGAKDHA